FPSSKEAEVKDLLEKQLAAMNAGIGFASAASGSDILFLEAMIARGGTIHLVLPWPAEEFVKTSVASAGDAWTDRFHRVIDRAASRVSRPTPITTTTNSKRGCVPPAARKSKPSCSRTLLVTASCRRQLSLSI